MKALLLILVLLSATSTALAEAPQEMRVGRFIMGFYANSITELASRGDIEVSLNFWAKDILAEEAVKQQLQITETQAILFDSMQEMHDAANRGEIDLIVAPPLMIVRNFNPQELEDGFTGVMEVGKTDDILLVARKDKQIRSVADLRGKHFIMPNNDEMVEAFIDNLFLKQLKIGYKKALGTVESEKKASRIILDIYFNKADAGIVYRNAFSVMSELNPDIQEQLIIIDSYPTKTRNFSYFINHYPYRKEIIDIMMKTINDSPRVKQILEVFKTQTTAACTVEELQPYIEFEKEYQALKRKLKQ